MANSELRNDALKNLKGTDLESYSLNNQELNLLTGWTYIAMFLVESRISLTLSESFNKKERFTEMEELTLAHGMFKNFVLSYSKCFSSSGKEKISIDSKEIFSSRPDLKLIHNKIMDIRNSYVAHNDDNDFDVSISMTSETDEEIILAQTYTIKTPLGDYKSFFETIEFCEEQIIAKFNKKVDKIQKRISKTISFR